MLDFKLLYEKWDESEREKVFQEILTDDELREGLAHLFALVYLENQYESGMQALLLRAVNIAEASMSDSERSLVARVDFDVEKIERVHYESAIEKFKSRKLSHMDRGEAKAIVNLLRRSRTVTSDDLEDMRQDIIDRFDELMEEHTEENMRSTDHRREKQLRHRELNDSEE